MHFMTTALMHWPSEVRLMIMSSTLARGGLKTLTWAAVEPL